MWPRKHTISCTELCRRWNTDVFGLSYLILKHDISLFDRTKLPFVKFSFDPDDYKIDSSELLQIIEYDPTELQNKTFWLPEIENLSSKKEILDLKQKISSGLKIKGSESTTSNRELGRYCLSERSTERIHEKPDKGKIKSSESTTSHHEQLRFRRPERSAERIDKKPHESEFENRRKKEFDNRRKKKNNFLRNVIEDQEPNIKQHWDAFLLLGKVWFVKYRCDEWGLFPDQEKYKYIANFLSLPALSPYNRNLEYEIYNTELVEKVKKKDISELYPGIDEYEELSDSSLSDELSPDEIGRFKDHGYNLLHKLNDGNDSGDNSRIKGAQTNFDNFRSHLINTYGIKTIVSKDMQDLYFKKLFRANREHEKIRQLIKNQTNNAIKDFGESMPTLRRHLSNSINAKLIKSTYTPETQLDWHVSM